MKVKNEYVQIKIGDKTYIKKNMLLNIYLNRILLSQIHGGNYDSEITNCYLKFDTPMENVDYNTVLYKSDFDVTLYDSTDEIHIGENRFNKMSIRNANSVRITYKFDNNNFFSYGNEYKKPNEFSIFNNRKITAIGFGNGRCLAFLDTSNMNLVINQNEKIEITRVDVFESYGVCKGLEFPLHLVNDSAHYRSRYENGDRYQTMAQIYSVGFGSAVGVMQEEHLVSEVQTERDNYSITFNIQRDKKTGVYPSNSLNTGFMPLKDNSKYLIFKYQLLERFSGGANTLNEYYTMSMPNDNFGDLDVKLKIERL